VATARAGFGSSSAPLDPDVRRRRLIAALAALGAVILVVVIALVAFGGGTKAPPTVPATTTAVTTTPAQTSTTPPKTTTKTTAPLKVVLPASGKLSQGDTGADVKLLQRALVKLAVATLTADGNFGAETESAVAAFQQVHSLTADGVVGAKTAQAINSALAAAG
jgi:peptidoglycan hydrolase-like protein with peptidoglycan-binding domain